MTKRDDKAGSPLLPTKILTTEQQDLIQQFSNLQDGMNNVFACYRFMGEAVLAMTDPERMDEFEDWHFGFFLHQQWTRQQGEKIMAVLVEVKQLLKS
jgi:hypothetical protein